MIRHIVCWRLAPEAAGADRDTNAVKVKECLEALIDTVPDLKAIEVGINMAPSEHASDVVLISTFEDETALERYRVHPEHVKAAEFVGSVTVERRVIDYTF